jgi:hypothetical protein
VFYLSDEIFAIRAPILVTIDAQSTAILKIELASDRSAKTWETHFKDLGAHRFHSLGMASDRGVGLKAGYQAACQEGFWVCDQFHEFQDLYNHFHQLERKAYSAIGKEIKAAATFANAKSEGNLQKRRDLYLMDQYYKRWVDANKTEGFLYATDDSVMRRLLRLGIEVQARGELGPLAQVLSSSDLEHLEAALAERTSDERRVYGSQKWMPQYRAELIETYERELLGEPLSGT